MSHILIARNPDLRQLRDDGYNIEVRASHLLVHEVPYVTADRRIARGILVMPLGDVAGNRIRPPSDHTAKFKGEFPCKADGTPLAAIRHSSNAENLGHGITVDHMFSAKPEKPDKDYYEKVTRYCSLLGDQAIVIDAKATAQTGRAVETTPEESVFHYADSNSVRAGIVALSARLAAERVAIVGLGGTGGYVLDLLAKTPIKEIHLFDADIFLNHNAFRAPGAPSLQRLQDPVSKVKYLAEIYGRMHRGIKSHEDFIDDSTLHLLAGMHFVFMCFDDGPSKSKLADALDRTDVGFIDVGMGILKNEGGLHGLLRVTTSVLGRRDHFRRRVPRAQDIGPNVYDENIQVADLNALNAALAVIKWKRLRGFYHDLEKEHNSTYTIDGNVIGNEDY